jgi:endonuclease/exonuclease/phosphatase family metal-dependent hydrolase
MDNNIKIKWCCENQVKPLFDDINEFDYYEPIIRLNKNNNYLNEYITINNTQQKKSLEPIQLKQNEKNDLVMNYYIKSQKDLSIISVFPKALKQKNKVQIFLKELEENGTIYYIKDINLDYYSMYNIIYQYYASEYRMKNNGNLTFKLDRIGFDINRTDDIKIIVYKHKNKEVPISGNSSPFKMKLREIFLEEGNTTYDYLHVSNDDNQTYEYSNMYFHAQTLKSLKRQQSWRLLYMYKSIQLFNKFKSFIYKYSQNEVENSLLFSSAIIFSYGIREMNDLDIIMLPSPLVDTSSIDEIKKDGTIDIYYPTSSLINKQWEDELNSRAEILGASNYQELINNPKHYYYFMGIKFLRLKYDILTRFRRGRPAQITDLLIIRQLFGLKYMLTIPLKTKEYNEITKKDEEKNVDEEQFLGTVKYYLERRYFISLTTKQIKQWILLNQNGGDNNDNNNQLILLKNVSEDKYVYPEVSEAIKMGYVPKITIYNSNKPYLYPGESFSPFALKMCKHVEFTRPKGRNIIRVITFNVHNFISRCNQGIAPLFGDRLNPFDKPRNVSRFIDFFKRLNADVINLQEVVPVINQIIDEDITDYNFIRDNFNFSYLNKLMESIGYKYKIISSTQNGYFLKDEKRTYYFLGNAIYSKFKLINPKIHQFTFLNRNFITASININNKIINLVNCHWEYFNEDDKLIRQSNVMFNEISKEFKDLNNVILCGDFNINLFRKSKSPRYIGWEEKVGNYTKNFDKTNKDIPTNFMQEEITDYILLSKNASIKTIFSYTPITSLSDHYPLLTDFLV